MSPASEHPRAQVYEFADYRARRAARARSASPVRRQFLWKWPGSGQFTAAAFPLPAAPSFLHNIAR